MLASRVRLPMAVTTALASPSTTKVPAWSASPDVDGERARSRRSASTCRREAVRLEQPRGRPRSGRRPRAARGRRRPGRAASISRGRPSRMTVAARGSRSRRRSAARSARCSWANANSPLTTTMTTIATAELRHPGEEGQPRRAPQHDGEEVEELGSQDPPGRRRRRTRQDVRAVTSAA